MNISAIASSLSAPSRAAAASPARDAASGPDEVAAQRKKAAGQFEAILVRQLISKSVGSMMGKDDVAGSVYGDMMTDSIAQNLTAGQGLGLGRMIEKQLTPPAPKHPMAAAQTALHP